jgi:hypothetical protein
MELVPEPGELWEVVLPSRGKTENIKQLRLIKKSEMTYTFSEPDCSVFFPKPIHIPIPRCKLKRRVAERTTTRINGIPDEFYEEKEQQNTKPPVTYNWSFDPQKYLSGEIKPN